MTRRRILCRTFMLVLIAAVVCAMGVGTAAATITVDDSGGADYTRIQDAINAANEGNTILVYRGTYYENVNVNKRVTLQGEGADVVNVSAVSASDHVFEVTADDVNISGFKIVNATGNLNAGIFINNSNHCNISNNIANFNTHGIHLWQSNNTTLTDNNLSSNNYAGIYLYFSSNNTLHNSTILNNIIGIGLDSSSNNNMTSNNISYNGDGIFSFDLSAENLSSSNIILENTIANNNRGILFILTSTNNIIINNTLSNNYDGIIFDSFSNDNTIYNNYFDNTNNAIDDGNNIWNITKTAGLNIIGGSHLGGNYWSDYTGTDSNSDGIGDAPYSISGGAGAQDRYPLVQLYNLSNSDITPPVLAITSPADGATFTTNTTTISGTASDDVAVANVTVNGILATGTTSWSANIILTPGANIITAIATDTSGNTTTDTITITYIPTASGSSRIWYQGLSDPYTWTVQNFAGFYYDINDNIKTEEITIQGMSASRIIADGDITYTTKPKQISFEFSEWGKYDVVGFMGNKYFAGYNSNTTSAITSDSLSILNDNMLSKVLVDDDQKYTLLQNQTIELLEGYAIKMNQIDVNGNQIMLEILKNGASVDTGIVKPDNNPTYAYEKDIGTLDDLPIIVLHIDSVFQGTRTAVVTLDGLFQISDVYKSVEAGDKYGLMEITSASRDELKLENRVNVSLLASNITDLLGDVKIKVADDSNIRFELITESTDREIRGTVSEGTDPFTWNPYNFEGFYYNLDEDVISETMTIDPTGNTIETGDLVYVVQVQDVEFQYSLWGDYQVIGFMGEQHFAGYSSITDNDITGGYTFSLINEGMLRKVLVDTDEKYTLNQGNSLKLEEGYELKINQFDINGNQVLLELLKDGISIDTGVVKASDTYKYEKDVGTLEDVPIIIAHIQSVFVGTETSAVMIDGVFQISDNYRSVDAGTTYGEMEVKTVSSTAITMENDGDIILSAGKKINIIGNISIKVADSGVLRFYPLITNSPDLTIIYPANGATINISSIEVSGTAYASSGIDEIRVNGGAPVEFVTSVLSGIAVWSEVVSLTPGTNTIRVDAMDNGGNSTSKTIYVIYYAPLHVPSVSEPKQVRGKVARPSDVGDTFSHNTDIVWDASTFSGFYYNLDHDTGTESLKIIHNVANNNGDITDLSAMGGSNRTIYENHLIYSTSPQPKDFEGESFGNYSVIYFLAEQYFTGYDTGGLADDVKNAAKEGNALDSMNLLSGDDLSKVLIDSGDKYTITTGDGLKLKEGYVLNIPQVDLDGNKALFELTKDGRVVDTEVVHPGTSEDVYVYDELDLGDEYNVPIIIARIDTISRGNITNVVTIEGLFQISDTLTTVQSGDTYGELEVTGGTDTTIRMVNTNTDIILSKDSIKSISNTVKFKVADSNTLSFYPFVEISEPGTYEIRGSVARQCSIAGTVWNSDNFAGFYYDLDYNTGSEILTISESQNHLDTGVSREINTAALEYHTAAQTKRFDYGEFGIYSVVGFMAEPYFAGYVDVSPLIENSTKMITDDRSILVNGTISKILIDSDDKYTIATGGGLELKEGYVLNVKQVGLEGYNATFELTKYGEVIDTKVVYPGSDDVYVYDGKSLGDNDNYPLIIARIDAVFRGTDVNLVVIEGLFQISDTITSVKTGDKYGNLEVINVNPLSIVMENVDNSISLNQDSTISIFGDIKFRVADDTILRFYPFVAATIEEDDAGAPSVIEILSPTIGTLTGDVNGDGILSSVDALMALQMSAGNIAQDPAADVSGDGSVTSLDALMILQASVGAIVL